MVCVHRESRKQAGESEGASQASSLPSLACDDVGEVFGFGARISNGRNESSKPLHVRGTSRDAFHGMNDRTCHVQLRLLIVFHDSNPLYHRTSDERRNISLCSFCRLAGVYGMLFQRSE